MVMLPKSIESAAPAAATRHDGVTAARSRTGIGATHINGHNGFIPFPTSNSTAVERAARIEKTAGRLSAKAMKVSPEGTLEKRTEFLFTLGHAAAEIEHDESMRKRAEFEGNLYRIVRPQFTGAHRLLEDVYGWTECRRTPSFEVGGINPGPFARRQKHELVEIRKLQ